MFETAQAAEAAFYRAFEHGDLEAMMRVWAEDDAISCIHPMGPQLQGRSAVAQSWKAVFESSGEMRFHLSECEYTTEAGLSVHCVHENIRFGDGLAERAVVIATNVYRLTAQGWRLWRHHASPGHARSPAVAASPSGTVH